MAAPPTVKPRIAPAPAAAAGGAGCAGAGGHRQGRGRHHRLLRDHGEPAAAKGEYFWAGANSTHFFINPDKKIVVVFMTQVASVGAPNPYGFYFSNELRNVIYKDLK